MKNICASVGAVPAQEKKTAAEEEYTWKANETVLYLRENPDCQMAVGGEWHGNARGEIVGQPDIYFRHIITSKRCDTVWDAVDGYAGFDDRWADAWEKLATLIEDIPNLEKTVCTERSVMLSEKQKKNQEK